MNKPAVSPAPKYFLAILLRLVLSPKCYVLELFYEKTDGTFLKGDHDDEEDVD